MSLPNHLESFLGNIEAGWQRGADGVELPFQVARFQRVVGDGTVAFTTLGLGNHLLDGRTKQIRQEFMMIVPESLRDGPVLESCSKSEWEYWSRIARFSVAMFWGRKDHFLLVQRWRQYM